MTKTEEKIEFYIAEMEKLGISFEKDLFTKVVKGLGPSIFKKDAEVVSCSDAAEVLTVKKNFLIKKHGLEDSEKLDTAITAVCEKMGKSNKNKYRAIFYYILVEDLGLAANSDGIKRFAVSIGMNFYAPAFVGDKLIAEAKLIKGGKRISFYEILIIKDGEVIARGEAIVYSRGERIT